MSLVCQDPKVSSRQISRVLGCQIVLPPSPNVNMLNFSILGGIPYGSGQLLQYSIKTAQLGTDYIGNMSQDC